MKRTILFLAANPRGTDQLALDEEYKAIQRELRSTAGRDDFELRSEWAVGVDSLMDILNGLSPAVLHFSGHGSGAGRTTEPFSVPHRDFDSPHGSGILLQDGGAAQHVNDIALAKLIASAPFLPRVVVLNACHSAGIAESLRQVVDCVIAMDGAIDDASARSFAVAFYRALGYRLSVGAAVKQAIAVLDAKQLRGELVTCHPRQGVDPYQLYLTTPERALDPAASPAGEPPVARQAGREPSPSEWSAGGIHATHARANSLPAGSGAWPMAGGTYDLFIAHPPANRATARALYDRLQGGLQVFLASRSLAPDDRSEATVAAAQRSALITALLISPHADAAWYLGDEVLTAIALHRAAPSASRLVPVLFEAGIGLPSCLGACAPIVAHAGDLDRVAAHLRDRIAALPRDTTARTIASAWRTSDGRGSGDPFQLYQRLGQLNDATLEQVVAHAGIDRGSVAPRSAALAMRALDIAQLAALDPQLSRRLSAELDGRFRWTRR